LEKHGGCLSLTAMGAVAGPAWRFITVSFVGKSRFFKPDTGLNEVIGITF